LLEGGNPRNGHSTSCSAGFVTLEPVLEMISQSDRAKEVEDQDLGSGLLPVGV